MIARGHPLRFTFHLSALVVIIASTVVLLGEGQQRGSSAAAPAADQPPVLFNDVSKSAGVDFTHVNGASPQKFLVETMGSGGLFFDFDSDGSIDVFLVDGGSLADSQQQRRARHRLYRNQGNGTFKDVTSGSGITHSGYGMGGCAADIDNDGLPDLFVTGVGGNRLYRNVGGSRFRDVTSAAGVGRSQWSTSCAFADFDNDGLADLFVTQYVDAGMNNNRFCGDPSRNLRVYCHPLNYQPLPNLLYHNNGDGTFSDVGVRAGVATDRGNGLGVVVADYDEDGWPDVFVANDSVPNFLYRNTGRGTFEETALPAGVAVATDGKARAGMGTDFGDYDGDGRLDLLVTNHEFESTSLYRNLGRGIFAEATRESGLGPATYPFVGFGTVLFDYDNDGRLDIAIVNGHVVDNTAQVRSGSTYGQRRLLFRNIDGRHFVELGKSSGTGFAVEKVGRTLASGDIDNDGDLDLLVTNNGQSADVVRNDGGNRSNALIVRLVGMRSNRDAIGARLRAITGSTTQLREIKAGSSYLGMNDVRAHFGLGKDVQVDRLDIRWPSGRMESLQRVQANQIVTITEGAGVTKRVAFVR